MNNKQTFNSSDFLVTRSDLQAFKLHETTQELDVISKTVVELQLQAPNGIIALLEKLTLQLQILGTLFMQTTRNKAVDPMAEVVRRCAINKHGEWMIAAIKECFDIAGIPEAIKGEHQAKILKILNEATKRGLV